MKLAFVIMVLIVIFTVGCTQKEVITGNDSDAHGCKITAGYSWCEAKQKCLRSWEENCTGGIVAPIEDTTNETHLVGNDSDVHGCKPSAGYSWCEAKQKCLRSWEENCTEESIVTDTDSHGCKVLTGEVWCDVKNKCVMESEAPCEANLTLEQARSIARASTCMLQSDINADYLYNNITKTWWLGMKIYKPGCNPACVVDEKTNTAAINWRCTGLTK